jgi:asparagine synthase (glutamine-hydrolysing)
MSGVFGYVGWGTPAVAAAMARSAGHAQENLQNVDGACIRSAGPADVAYSIARNDCALALYGHPFIEHQGHRVTPIREVAAILVERMHDDAEAQLRTLGGDFVLAYAEPARNYLLLAPDRIGVRNAVYALAADVAVFGPDCDTIARHPALRPEIDPQQIYNYLYFHMVPGPATAYVGFRRVPAAHCVTIEHGRATLHRYWRMPFVEDRNGSFEALRARFRTALDTAVSTVDRPGSTGAFLSGGTDSSTICGLLARRAQQPVPAFSIGFDAPGYDEMDYARIAAGHFGLAHHTYYVTPADVVSAVPRIAEAYDQPFGNASAVPTYFCARLAKQHGISLLLAGDGGDELFGGNTRYARQRQFAYYERIPRALRQALLEPAARRFGATSPVLLRKARSYIEQASLPMPDRYDSYNLLERIGPASIFADDFLASVDPSVPLARQREVYEDTTAASLINRMLSFDFQFTLADNDLPKVTRMCELADIDVAFPMLDDGVVAFSATLAPDLKLRGTTLRYFFKRALADFLPPRIIAKEKHGFGLPFGVWLTKDRQLRELASDSLNAIRTRGFVRPEFVDQLLDRDVAMHPGYYGSMVWILMMLEQWYRRAPRT